MLPQSGKWAKTVVAYELYIYRVSGKKVKIVFVITLSIFH